MEIDNALSSTATAQAATQQRAKQAENNERLENKEEQTVVREDQASISDTKSKQLEASLNLQSREQARRAAERAVDDLRTQSNNAVNAHRDISNDRVANLLGVDAAA